MPDRSVPSSKRTGTGNSLSDRSCFESRYDDIKKGHRALMTHISQPTLFPFNEDKQHLDPKCTLELVVAALQKEWLTIPLKSTLQFGEVMRDSQTGVLSFSIHLDDVQSLLCQITERNGQLGVAFKAYKSSSQELRDKAIRHEVVLRMRAEKFLTQISTAQSAQPTQPTEGPNSLGGESFPSKGPFWNRFIKGLL
jgi:hypothetical protein